MEPPRIGSFLADRMRPLIGVAEMPGNGIERAVRGAGSPRAAGVFPFRFGRQPILPILLQNAGITIDLGELAAELGGPLPADRVDGRVPGCSWVVRWAFFRPGMGSVPRTWDYQLELSLGHGRRAEIKLIG